MRTTTNRKDSDGDEVASPLLAAFAAPLLGEGGGDGGRDREYCKGNVARPLEMFAMRRTPFLTQSSEPYIVNPAPYTPPYILHPYPLDPHVFRLRLEPKT